MKDTMLDNPLACCTHPLQNSLWDEKFLYSFDIAAYKAIESLEFRSLECPENHLCGLWLAATHYPLLLLSLLLLLLLLFSILL